MSHQRGLHLEGRDIDAADLEHVVGAAAIGEIASGVLDILVAAAGPGPEKSLARALALVPVEGGAGRSGDLKLANFAGRRGRAVVPDQPNLVAWHRLAGGAVT